MKPLHDKDDAAVTLAVKTADERMVIPFVDGFPLGLGKCFIRLKGIVDDNEVGPSPGEHPTDGSGQARPSTCGHKVIYCWLSHCKARCWEQTLIPLCYHHR